jgi:hypothetical protein
LRKNTGYSGFGISSIVHRIRSSAAAAAATPEAAGGLADADDVLRCCCGCCAAAALPADALPAADLPVAASAEADADEGRVARVDRLALALPRVGLVALLGLLSVISSMYRRA